MEMARTAWCALDASSPSTALGSVAGDIALVQGAAGVVIAGGLGYRIREILLASGFGDPAGAVPLLVVKSRLTFTRST